MYGVARNVTERKQEEAALLKAGMLQNAIFNSANFSCIATDAKGVIQLFNVGAEQMLGYAAAEVVNRITPADLHDPQEMIARARSLSEELETTIAPGFEALAFKAARGIEDVYELTKIRKNGSRFPAVVSVTALRDERGGIIGYLLIGTDNTARKLAEEALLKAGALQRAIFNSANFSSIATDANGVIQIFNVGAERMLGYAAAEVMNQITPADISDPQEVIARATALSIELGTPITPGFEALVFKASRGIEDIYELTYIRKDGSRFPAVVSVTALRDAQDRIIGYLLIGTDNTARQQVEEERKRFEQALQKSNVELEQARFVAEKANLAKSDFLSNMSHELRSPLNAILGFAQLMESAAPPPTVSQHKSIAQILQAGWYLLKLINEVLDLAGIESGKLSLSKEAVSLSEVMSECQSMMEPEAQARGIHMTFPGFESPVFVSADRTRLKQIVINLLSNAVKYNKERGTVVVGCTVSGPGTHSGISVKDTGAGLPPEQLTQLFRPFNRLGKEAGSVAGTGIGLVVSKRLAELMGGIIGVESTVGMGCVFWCELASSEEPPGADENGEAKALVQSEVSGDAPQRTVLYVEDNPANMALVEQLIARFPDLQAGVTAVNGTLGIERARELLPQVILMDINLPGISGIKALKILRKDPVTAYIPVIALSANAMSRDIEKGLEAGFFRYLTKPIKIKELMVTLNEALRSSEKVVGHALNEGQLAVISSTDILKASILIVDDQEANVLLLEQMLWGAGYVSVTSTKDSHSVFELHRRNHYSLILLDLQMPGLDGFQVMEALKTIETGGYLPVLAQTSQPNHRLRALKAGARDFVSKPFDIAEILLRVHHMIEVRLLHQEAARRTEQAGVAERGDQGILQGNRGFEVCTERACHRGHHRPAGKNHLRQRKVLCDFQILP